MTDQVRVIIVGDSLAVAELVQLLPDWVTVVEQQEVLEPQEAWIPIAKQLPELDVEVIAHNDITQAMGFASIWEVDNGRPRWDRWPNPNKPTHWRAAPVRLPARADPRDDMGTLICMVPG